MDMSKKRNYRNISLTICMFFIMFAFVINGVAKTKKEEQKTEAHHALQQEDIKENKYIIKIYNGKLAVFENKSDKPFFITEISERSLRNYDREMLANGIFANSDIELAMLLEDFGS